MRITGAVLEEIGLERPYAVSQPLKVRELELAEPGPGELLVRVEVAGLCHSDLSVVNGDRVRPVPMLLGHEAAGIVEAVGPGGSDLGVGQRVVMTFLPRCGDCAGCRTDGVRPCVPGSAANGAGTLLGGDVRLSGDAGPVLHHLGVSAFASHAVVDRRSVVPVADDVPADVAALLGCAVLTGGGALLNAAPPAPGSTVTVVGLGGVGMAALLTALALDVEVVAVDTVPEKLAIATRLGAVRTAHPDEVGDPDLLGDVVVEAAGSARAFETAVALTAAGGTTVTVGLPHPDARASVSPLGLVAEGRTIVGSYLGSAVPSRDIPRFAELWRAGRLPVEELVSSTIPLADINTALDVLSDGAALRQLVVFG
ncbi:alcohol dehydrogenase catalytic domain-containing protein [Nocardioides lianchengensis]|uniref:Alcohol dehydrogenase n=1 Tax=Nocardioides lianchengensis TaxID=1045774 RepID=A0A1G6V1V7_9ACTN|nr:alcohol dehydrogenase catalytic domain-containing protein [Nocardioides lianchengensis]NYG11112.1 alcohol dehydrogenase [Nocardioides lianchengensis]SDD47629.1 alcohol dehydrogenase [Nocardioides lianchengensis]